MTTLGDLIDRALAARDERNRYLGFESVDSRRRMMAEIGRDEAATTPVQMRREGVAAWAARRAALRARSDTRQFTRTESAWADMCREFVGKEKGAE